jgi:thiamine biosynthesis lipoprotein
MLSVLLILTIFRSNKTDEQKNIYTREAFLMDTLVTIKIYDTNKTLAQKAVKKALDEIKNIDKISDNFNPDSEISKINKKQEKQNIKTSDDLFKMLSLSKQYGTLTKNSFDVTIAPLVSLWSFEDKKHVPTQSELKKALSVIDLNSLYLNKKDQTISLLKKNMSLDLGGIAKGYAVDKAIVALKKYGIKNALVSTESTTGIIGKKLNKDWTIGIQNPRKKDEIIGTIALKDKSVSASGDYQRFFIKDGIRYHHILSPRTGMPAKEIMSITIITSRGNAESDILSTAIFVMGYKDGLEFINKNNDIDGIIITSDGKIHLSKRLVKLSSRFKSKIF